MMRNHRKVVIIGGGPAGLAAAIESAQASRVSYIEHSLTVWDRLS